MVFSHFTCIYTKFSNLTRQFEIMKLRYHLKNTAGFLIKMPRLRHTGQHFANQIKPSWCWKYKQPFMSLISREPKCTMFFIKSNLFVWRSLKKNLHAQLSATYMKVYLNILIKCLNSGIWWQVWKTKSHVKLVI